MADNVKLIIDLEANRQNLSRFRKIVEDELSKIIIKDAKLSKIKVGDVAGTLVKSATTGSKKKRKDLQEEVVGVFAKKVKEAQYSVDKANDSLVAQFYRVNKLNDKLEEATKSTGSTSKATSDLKKELSAAKKDLRNRERTLDKANIKLAETVKQLESLGQIIKAINSGKPSIDAMSRRQFGGISKDSSGIESRLLETPGNRFRRFGKTKGISEGEAHVIPQNFHIPFNEDDPPPFRQTRRDRAQEASMRFSDRESERERVALQKELRAIALSEAKSFANAQARAGRTLEETLTTIRSSLASVLQINPVVGSLVKAIGDSEDVFSILDRNLLKITNAVRARFEVAAGKFESRFVKENKDRTNFDNLEKVVEKARGDLQRRFGIFGLALDSATNSIREGLIAEIDKSVNIREKSNKSARQQLRTEINAEARELFGRNKGQLSSIEELDTVLSFFAHDLNTRFSGMGVYIDRVSALLRDKLAKSINKSAESQIDAGAKELLARNKGQLSSMEELETVLAFFAHDLKTKFSGMGTYIDKVSSAIRDKLTPSIEKRAEEENKARIQQLVRDKKLNQASAKLLASQVKQFENSFISDNAKGTSFNNLGLVIDKFSSSLYNRFGDLGEAAKTATDIVRNKLVKILEARWVAETRDESARTAAAQKLANAEAKRLANLNARLKTKDGRFAFDVGDIDKDKLRKTLENQFGISGNRLKEAVDVFIGEFIKVRDKQIEEIAKSAEQESKQRIKLANEFAKRIAAEQEAARRDGRRVSLEEIDIKDISSVLADQFKIGGQKIDNAIRLFVNEFEKLRKARNEETLKGIRQEAESRVKLARAEAKRIAAIISAGLSAGELRKADLSGHVRLAIVALGRQFGIAGSGLREAAQELADELNRLRAKTRQQSSQISESLRAAFANIRARKFAAQIEGLSGSGGGPRVSGPQNIKLDVLAAMLQQDFQISGTNLKNAVVAFINEFNKLRNQRVANEQRHQQREDGLRNRLFKIDQDILSAQSAKLRVLQRQFADASLSSSGPSGSPLPGQPNKPQFPTSLKGIATFANKLSPQDQERFARALRDQAFAANKASNALRAHNGNIAKGTGLVNRLTREMDTATKAAFTFGFAASDAATRLLAWASPASFVFTAVAGIREATSAIIELDKQSRRLAFATVGEKLQEAIGNEITPESAQAGIARLAVESRKSFDTIIREAKRTGLAIADVANAVETIEKIGISTFQADGQPTLFLEAVEALLKVEAGEITAERAAKLLNSTLQQTNLGLEDSLRIAARYSEVARKAALSVDELGTIMSRTLPAFEAVSGTGVDEMLEIVAIAFDRFGTNASRTATALQGIPRFMVQFRKEIEKFTGIKIADENGNLIGGLDAQLAVLEEIDKLKGTTAGFELANRIAESEHISDMLNLADAAKKMRQEIDKIRNDTSGNIASNAVAQLLIGTENASKDLSSAINNLRTSIAELVDKTGFPEFLKSLTVGATGFTNALTKGVEELKGAEGIIRPILALLGGAALFKFTKLASAATQGFGAGFITRQIGDETRQQLTSTDRKEIETLTQINIAKKEGLLTDKQASDLRIKSNRVLEAEARTHFRIEKAKLKLKALEASSTASINQVAAARKRLETLEIRQHQILLTELKIREQIRNVANSTQANADAFGRRNQGALIAGVGFAASVAVGEVANELSKDKSTEKFANALNAAVPGAIIGVGVGSAIPLIGNIAGGVIGAVGGATVSAVSSVSSASREARENLERAISIRIKSEQAANRQRAEVIRRNKLQLETIEQQTVAQQHLNELQVEHKLLLIEIDKLAAQGADSSKAKAELERISNDIATKSQQVDKERIISQQRSIEFEKQRIRLTQENQQNIKNLSLLEKARISALRQLGAKDVTIENVSIKFDRERLKSDLQTIAREIAQIDAEIISLRNEPGHGSEIKKLEKDREKLVQDEINKKLEAENIIFDKRQRILDSARRAAEEQINAWKEASKEVANALKSVMDEQIKVADAIATSNEIELQISNIDNSFKKIGREIGFGIDSRVATLSSAREGVQDSRNRLFAAESNIIATVNETDIRRLSPPDEIFENLIVASKNFVEAFSVNSKVLTDTQKLQRAFAESELNRLKTEAQAEIDFSKKLINLKKEEFSATKELVDSTVVLIKAQQDLSENAKRGRDIIERPGEVFKDLKNISSVVGSGLLRRGKDGTIDVEKFEKNIRTALGAGPAGQALIQRTLVGLDAAVSQNIRLAKNFTPEQLRDIFLSIVGGRKGETSATVEAIRAQTTLISQMKENLKENLDNQFELSGDIITLQQALSYTQSEQARVAEEIAASESRLIEKSLQDSASAQSSMGDAIKEIEDRLGKKLVSNTSYESGVGIINGTLKKILSAITGRPIEEEVPPSNKDSVRDELQPSRFLPENKKPGTTTTTTSSLGPSVPTSTPTPAATPEKIKKEIASAIEGVSKASPEQIRKEIAKEISSIPKEESFEDRARKFLGEERFRAASDRLAERDERVRRFAEDDRFRPSIPLEDIPRGTGAVTPEALADEVEKAVNKITGAGVEIAEALDADKFAKALNDAATKQAAANVEKMMDELDRVRATNNANRENNRTELPSEVFAGIQESMKTAMSEAGIQLTTSIRTSVESGVRSLTDAIKEGIRVDQIRLEVFGRLTQELETSPELIEALRSLTGGNDAEVERLKRVVVELVDRERQRNVPISTVELELIGEEIRQISGQ